MKNENTIITDAYPDIYVAVAEYFENRELEDDFFNKYAIRFCRHLAYLQRTEQCVEKWIKYIKRTYGTATDEYNVFVYCAISITANDSVLHNRLKNDIYYKQPDKFIEVLSKYKDMKRQPLPQLVFKVEGSQKNEPIFAEPSPLYRHKGIVYDLTKCTQDDLEYLYLINDCDEIYCEIAPQASTDTETLPTKKETPQASTETNVKRFDYANHIDKITKIFDILNNNKNTDLPTFLHCVVTADFSSIYIKQQKKSVRLAIKHIKDLLGDEWYTQAANNINTEKSVISGTADEPTEELLREITKKPKRSYNK